ncbi:hypothetical protein IB276_33265 [Ensifer sp. ENS04]|uniref:hypothetical protein n=1 Tax=Ensifer sp. ENS04 TaxID=2769281 RepID=UPI0017820DAD|nr:hypothetical protein [Ensifer sp. ENS04]MBD9544318.1 hypothetical protein [Ensifer sp. ENS04]
MVFRTDAPTIELDQLVWDETGHEEDPRARLCTHIKIGPIDMHLEAWEVSYDTEGFQVATPATYRVDDFDTLIGMMESDFRTLEIEGREYALIATPYGR